ncbi:MAG: formylglycine-generating enzyme family protein, partial [bacterium]|nr:formylglycine-generating enzyme family protein [bacterium]
AMARRPRATGGLPDDRGIVGNLEREKVRMDYSAYYCDELCLVPTADAQRAKPTTPPAPPRSAERAAGPAPELPDADLATITLPDGRTAMEVVRIPGGRFLMGGDSTTGWANDDEFPRHHVTLDTYWIGKCEVTNAQYKAFCDETGHPYPPDPAFSKIPWVHRNRRYHYGDYFTGMPDHPVVNVTWYDVQAFCRWAGLRLPTAAEWEMAARGHGDSLRTYPWGEQTNPAWTTRTRDNLSIQKPDGNVYTCPVDKFASHHRPDKVGASPFGAAGMGGNAREWCADWYGPYAAQPLQNPSGPETGTRKVLRGGCWR